DCEKGKKEKGDVISNLGSQIAGLYKCEIRTRDFDRVMLLLLSAIRNPQSEIGTQGSPLWQVVFISFAVILILLEVIRGWRLGIMRQAMRIVAVLAGYAAAYFGGGLLVPLLRSWLRIPDVFVSAVGGAILAVIVYATIASLGSLLFKRTAQQDSGTK